MLNSEQRTHLVTAVIAAAISLGLFAGSVQAGNVVAGWPEPYLLAAGLHALAAVYVGWRRAKLLPAIAVGASLPWFVFVAGGMLGAATDAKGLMALIFPPLVLIPIGVGGALGWFLRWLANRMAPNPR